MQQDTPLNPTPTMVNNTTPNISKSTGSRLLKPALIIVSIIALCGVAFGIYCIVNICQKDSRIAELEAQLDQKTETTDDGSVVNSSDTVADLYLLGDITTKRKYYLGTPDLDPSQDAREMNLYLIDSTKLNTKDGVKKYDLKPVLNQILDTKVTSLPDILGEGTVNEIPKSSCQSYKMSVGDPNNMSGMFDRTAMEVDWSNLLPFTIYAACITPDGTEFSLGTEFYSLNPDTNELFLVNKSGLVKF